MKKLSLSVIGMSVVAAFALPVQAANQGQIELRGSVAQNCGVVLTAKSQDKDIREMLATGALDVIPKPFDAIKLPDQLKEIWGRSRSQKNEV
jgi:DNA-binding response OmpR family regulator